MKFGCVLLAVADIGRARRFYESLFGLTVENDFGENVAYTCGLALQQNFARLAGVPAAGGTWGELYFEEDELDAFVEKLAAVPGVRYVHPVRRHSWGQRVIRFYDPDGHIVEVGESMAFVARRFLQEGLTAAETARITQLSPGQVEQLAQK